MIKAIRQSETDHTEKHSPQNVPAKRESRMRKLCAGVLTGLAALWPLHASAAHAAETGASKPLIVYFSHSGNTRAVAELIRKRVGGDLLELKTTRAYPSEYKATTEQAKKELNDNFRPQLANDIDNLDSYDVIFIGYPTWWGTMPMALFTFLEKHDLSGKTVVPFCTHGGSGFGRGKEDIARLCPNAKMLEGLSVRGSNAANAGDDVDEWLRDIGMSK